MLRRAIIFALESIIHVVVDDSGYRWEFDPRLPGMLRDCQATGHRIFGLLDPSAYGLVLETREEQGEVVDYINRRLIAARAPAFDDVHVSDDISDPQPVWAWRRRFGISLASSMIIGVGPSYERLRRNAGLSGAHLTPSSTDELFGRQLSFSY